MGETVAEKILSAHANHKVKAGDFSVCKVDFSFGQDGTSAIIIDRINQLKVKKLKTKFCLVIDHSAPSPNEGVSRVHSKMRQFSRHFRCGLYDIGCGICHQVIPESGQILPGDLVLGADSHTSTYGALGAFATGVGSTDVAVTLATGRNWFKVPQTIKVIVKGALPKGVFAKDIILHIISRLGSNGANYLAMEFCGSAIDDLEMDGRFTICNMVVEMGAKAGFMPVDSKTIAWLRPLTARKIKPVLADKDASYKKILEYDVSKLSPQVACPHSVDNVKPAEVLHGVRIDEAFLGTCTNARLQDLKVAASILKGKTVAKGVKFIVAAASRKIFLQALRQGIVDVFIRSGAVLVTPGCGPCVGTHNGIPADGENVISSSNRNFKGRMGNPNAFVYLASPATVAASALKGRIADPREYL